MVKYVSGLNVDTEDRPFVKLTDLEVIYQEASFAIATENCNPS